VLPTGLFILPDGQADRCPSRKILIPHYWVGSLDAFRQMLTLATRSAFASKRHRTQRKYRQFRRFWRKTRPHLGHV